MEWGDWLQGVGNTLLDGGVKYATNNQANQLAYQNNLLQLQQMQMQAFNNWGQPYIEGQPVAAGLGIPPGLLLIGAVVLVVVMVKN